SEDQRGVPGGFVGDPDIFDTWATSALTPLIPSGWPHDLGRHKALYPNSLRPNAHDIIRTWDFVTITRSYLEDGSIPWTDVAISGWILDPDRKKMGKSRGNAMVPTEMLEEFGADAVRYWSASAKLGVDTTIDKNVFREGKRLVTKLLNAGRLIKGYEGSGGPPTHPLDRALLARLRKVVQEADKRWTSWDHAAALAVTESWFWSDFTDNYLELSKARSYAGDASALGTLRLALDVVLRLLAPVLIYATEEVWNDGREPQASVHIAQWPTPDELEGEDGGGFDAAVIVLSQIRKAKSDASVSIKFPVRNLQVRGPAAQLRILEGVLSDVLTTGSVENYELLPDQTAESLAASVTLGDAPQSTDR
ncbi:MAG: valine--tRNA ligase, partial [Actinobacteria bacterium]|nr:valine--tRNA ligase [Actinomycetota bacterium]